MINEMETISITYRGIVHKLTEYEKLVDTIEMIYTMDKEETPLLYAAKINPSSSFKTLRVLSSKTIN